VNLRGKLRRLEASEADAHERVKETALALREEWRLSEQLLAPWTTASARREEPTREQLKLWTEALLDEVQRRHLAFALDPRQPGHRAVVVIDPEASAAHGRALRDQGVAREARQAFARDNADALREEASREEVARFREAQERRDIGQMREILA
jgi:hypothetical protein